ncbi:MAG: hypothetical protein ACPG7S_05750, partial [Miltoncostaeaceae bacterium]
REVGELVGEVLGRSGWQIWPYRTLFQQVLDVDPLEDGVDDAQLSELAVRSVAPPPAADS